MTRDEAVLFAPLLSQPGFRGVEKSSGLSLTYPVTLGNPFDLPEPKFPHHLNNANTVIITTFGEGPVVYKECFVCEAFGSHKNY